MFASLVSRSARVLLRGGTAAGAAVAALSFNSQATDCAIATPPTSLAAAHDATVLVKKDSTDRSEPEITLEYFCLRGLGELPRLVLETTGIPYKSVFHFGEPAWRSYAPFGQLPVLRHGSMVLCESNAIARHLARVACIDGATLEEKALVDMYFELSRDILAKKGAAHDLTTHPDAERLKSFLLRAEEACVGGHFVGSTLTFADVAMFHALSFFAEVAPATLDPYPKLGAFVTAFGAQPTVAEYLASPRRVPLTSNELGKGHTGLSGYQYIQPLRYATYATKWEGP